MDMAAGGGMPEEEMPTNLVDDWMEQQDQLPDRCPSFIEQRYQQLFALDVCGVVGHDQYVFVAPNGVAVVGLAPSHVMIRAQRSTPDAPAQAEAGRTEAAAAAAAGDGVSDVVATADGNNAAPLEPAAATAEAGVDQRQGSPSTGAPDGEQAAVAAEASASAQDEEDEDEAEEDAGAPAGQADAGGDAAGAQEAGASSKQQARNKRGKRKRGQDGQPLKSVTVFPPSTLARVEFDVGRHGANAMTKQSGKNRSQGSQMYANSLLAKLESTNGESMAVRCVVPGKLLEVNQRLLEQPQLLLNRPCREGYVAIMYPSELQLAALRASLLGVADYLAKRGLTAEDLL